MWSFSVVLAVAALHGSGISYAQNDEAPLPDIFGADGFVFDGPASGPRSTASGATTVTPPPQPTTTTMTTSMASTSPEMDQCLARCSTTPEYNPVCGSDNVNYDNPGRLSCAATCGKDVTLSHYGRCMTSKIRGG